MIPSSPSTFTAAAFHAERKHAVEMLLTALSVVVWTLAVIGGLEVAADVVAIVNAPPVEAPVCPVVEALPPVVFYAEPAPKPMPPFPFRKVF